MEHSVKHTQTIATRLDLPAAKVDAAAKLLGTGATVPFIARYRKEATGLLDEMQITAIRDQLTALAELDKRRSAILTSLAERDMLDDQLRKDLLNAENLAALEDIYLPYRPKRRTRSTIARGKGLEPLAQQIMQDINDNLHPDRFVNIAKEVHTPEEALAGARDIMAEWISEDQGVRTRLRRIFFSRAIIIARAIKNKQDQGSKFRDYFDYHEAVKSAAGHRLLALFRGECEKILSLSCRPPEEDVLPELINRYVKKQSFCGSQIELAVQDSYKRLLAPSLENELRAHLKEQADTEAIGVFMKNLRELLLAPPLGQKRVMALDPGYRTGAKLVCLDGQGNLLHHTVVYPTHSERRVAEAADTVKKLCRRFAIEAIAIGNGTAGRETENFIRSLALGNEVLITMVDESGASIYSASQTAREEFPHHDVTVRGAVSIGRRLQDPLAELVKIDPKSIGVGQYQHDVNQTALKKSLEDVVISCVNSVGVEINTASRELLSYVSGLGPVLAGNIVEYRRKNGPFHDRKELLKVPRLGARAFEQCAGFLRIHDAENPLDASGVHPEQYATVQRMARDASCSIAALMASESLRQQLDISRYVSDTTGIPTLKDIMAELARPGRDPRKTFTLFAFSEDVHSIDDLRPGMKLPGIVTNVTKFGAFVDVGVHQDGLVHISQLADRFVKDPAEIVRVRQQVTVRVLEVDAARKRISLSLREDS